jgi:glucan biosynthesis protein C
MATCRTLVEAIVSLYVLTMDRRSPRPAYLRRRRLLWVGVAAPLVAGGTIVAAIAAYPGFNNANQYLSALGGPLAAKPAIFNVGVMAAGLMAGVAGIGFALALTALTRGRVVAVLTGLVFLLASAGLVMASLYPTPDPRHQMINLGLGIQIAPLLLIWGLARRRDFWRLRLFLAIVFIIMAVLTVLTKHLLWPGLVNDANVGWWERAFAVVLCGWVGIAAFILERRLLSEAADPKE